MADESVAVIVVTAIFSVLMTVSVVIRYSVRYFQQNGFGALDDWALGPAFIFTWACAGCNFISADYSNQAGYDEARLNTYLLASQVCWVLAATSSKIALVLYFRRLFILRWVVVSTRVLVTLLGALCVASIAFYAANAGYSLSGNAGIGAADSLLGIAVMAIPPAVIFILNMSLRSKFVKFFWYGLGWIALAFGLVRVATFRVLDTPLFSQRWELLLVWSILEPSTYIIAMCIPTVRQLWREPQRQAALARIQTTARNPRDDRAGMIQWPGEVSTESGPSRGRDPNTSRATEPIELPVYPPTAHETPGVTRNSSNRTGMYTYWRADGDDSDGYNVQAV